MNMLMHAYNQIFPIQAPPQKQVLLGRIEHGGPAPLSGKARTMAAQRAGRRVEVITWRPSVMPRGGEPTAEDFVMIRSKLIPKSVVIEDDDVVALCAPPSVLFEMALQNLGKSDQLEREEAFNGLLTLATEGSHALSCESRYFVGECCLYGRGTPRDPARAARWFKTVRPVPWPAGLVHSPQNAQAQAQFLVGDLYEYGGVGSGAANAVGGGLFQPDAHKALTWYARSAVRGHPLAALSAGEMLAQSGGRVPRPQGVNYEAFGAHQARRIAHAGGAVSIARERGWRLGYFTDDSGRRRRSEHSFHGEDPYVRARSYFLEVIELTGASPPADRDTLHWEKKSSGSVTPASLSRPATSGGTTTRFPAAIKGANREEASRQTNRKVSATKAAAAALSAVSPITGGGGPADWPGYRCRAFLGLAMLAQEGLGTSGPPSMERAVGYLCRALCSAGDSEAMLIVGAEYFSSREFSEAVSSASAATSPFAPIFASSVGTQAQSSGGTNGGGSKSASTIVVFSLALCFHFGRGVAQGLHKGRQLYGAFLRRGSSPSASVPGSPDFDPVATHQHWRALVTTLQRHCDQISDKQQALMATAASLTEG